MCHPNCFSIKDVLENLEGKRCIIVLKCCRSQCVRIKCVSGSVCICELLGARNCPVKFVDIDSIAEVICDCRSLLDNFLCPGSV